MKSEQIKEITEKATEQLVAALQQGRSEALTAYLKAIGRFPSLQPAQRVAYRYAETECQLRRGLSHLERPRPLRQEGREGHRDSRPHRATQGGELR
jgi:hypothetical protein